MNNKTKNLLEKKYFEPKQRVHKECAKEYFEKHKE